MSQPPPTACRSAWAKRLERAFAGKLSRRRLRALREHAGSCDACRAVYDHLAYAERALFGSPFPPPAVERVATLTLTAPSRSRRLWAPAGALAAAVAAVLMWVVISPPAPRDELRARGKPAIEPLAPGQREPGVRMFCVEISDTGAEVTDEVHMASGTMPAPILRCTIDGELQIAYSTPNLPGLSMIVFADSPSGATHWYAPAQPGAPSVPLAADVVDEPLSWSTRLSAEHAPGTYEVTARVFVGPTPASPGAGNPASELRAQLVIETADGEAP